jgi:hypothetical protein
MCAFYAEEIVEIKQFDIISVTSVAPGIIPENFAKHKILCRLDIPQCPVVHNK